MQSQQTLLFLDLKSLDKDLESRKILGVQNPYKFLPTDETPQNQSLANTRWLKMASAGLSANILAYRDDDWITLANVPESDEQDPDVVVPRFNDIAPLYDQYSFSNPDFNDAPQQEGAIPLPAWGWEATFNAYIRRSGGVCESFELQETL